MEKVIVLDFDNTFYTKDSGKKSIEELENRINLAILKSILDIKDEETFKKGLNHLKMLFQDTPKQQEKILNYFAKRQIIGSYDYEKIKSTEHMVIANMLGEIYTSTTKPNHRCYGPMHEDGFNVSLETIRSNYTQLATINYNGIQRNTHIQNIINNAIKKNTPLIIYTDNSKENVEKGLKALGFKSGTFCTIIDMFQTGGYTKKTKEGVEQFQTLLSKSKIDISNCAFYDDSTGVLDNMSKYIRSYLVTDEGVSLYPHDIKDIINF